MRAVSLWINLSGIVISKGCHQIEWSEKASAIFRHPGFYGDEIYKDTKFKYDTFKSSKKSYLQIQLFSHHSQLVEEGLICYEYRGSDSTTSRSK